MTSNLLGKRVRGTRTVRNPKWLEWRTKVQALRNAGDDYGEPTEPACWIRATFEGRCCAVDSTQNKELLVWLTDQDGAIQMIDGDLVVLPLEDVKEGRI